MKSTSPMLDPTFVAAFRSDTLTPEHAEAIHPRELDPLHTILDALRNYATTGTLPALPEKARSEG